MVHIFKAVNDTLLGYIIYLLSIYLSIGLFIHLSTFYLSIDTF